MYMSFKHKYFIDGGYKKQEDKQTYGGASEYIFNIFLNLFIIMIKSSVKI